MKAADLLSEIRTLRVFTAGNATLATIKNSPLVCDGLCVDEFVADFIPALPSGISEERSAALEQALVSKLEARLGSFDVVVLHDQAINASASSFTETVRHALERLTTRFRGKTVWVRTPRPELFRDVIHELSAHAVEAASGRLPQHPDLQRLYAVCGSRLMVVSGGPRDIVVVQGSREDRLPLGAAWSENAAVAFTFATACALSVSGSPLVAARFGIVAAAVAAESANGAVSASAIGSAYAAQARS
jgi:hypothetical protein